MNWEEKIREKLLEHSVAAVLALIVLLLSIIYWAVPSEVWGKASEVIPKRVLWALLGLELIIIAVLGAFALDNKRKRKVTLVALAAALSQPPAPVAKPRRMLGIFWDDEHNPLCPVCEILLHLFFIDRGDEGSDEALRCPKCKAEYTLLDDEGCRHSLLEVKDFLSGKTATLE